MIEEASLRPSIHMVTVRDDVVILDVVSDRYSCLVGAASLLTVRPAARVQAEAEVLDDLRSAGLLAADIPPPDRRTPILPTAELAPGQSVSALRFLDTGVRALTATARFRRKTLGQLVALNRRSPLHTDPAALGRIAAWTAAYCAVLPLLPYEGLCLQRAYQLRQVLASDGLSVDWVFGVRTWPFFAHCWLQHGERVVGDRLERVRAFTPIAVF